MDEQNILETQLILGKQVLEIVFDFAKKWLKNRGNFAFKHKRKGFYYHSWEGGRRMIPDDQFIRELIEDEDIIFNKDSDYHKQRKKEKKNPIFKRNNSKKVRR